MGRALKMMGRAACLGAGAVLLAGCLAGCNDLSAPELTVGSAYRNLMKGNEKAFREELSGDALTTYSSADAQAALRQKLSGLKLVTGYEQQISSENEGDGQWLVKYSVPVLSETAAGGTTTQAAELHALLDCVYSAPAICIDPAAVPDSDECQNVSSSCTISSLQF